MDTWGRVSGALGPHRPLAEHAYLAVIGVHPTHWGKGVGGRLLEALEAGVAERGGTPARSAPIYLECDRPESAAFYRARGFADLHAVEVEGIECWGMGRGFDPQS